MKLSQTIKTIEENSEYLSSFVEICNLLANERRAKIVYALASKEYTAGQIGQLINVSQSASSQHIKALKLANALIMRRHGSTLYYSTSPDYLRKIVSSANIFNTDSVQNSKM